MITIVSAFIPIPDHPRSADEYHRLGEHLLALGAYVPLLYAEGDLEHCWLRNFLISRPDGFTWSTADNPQKNSVSYHCVQAQKTQMLAAAAMVDQVSDVFVWIDYGIFHIPGVTDKIILEFLRRADSERAIAIPGCWERGKFVYDDNWPCWRFCGGLMVVPRAHIENLHAAMKNEYVRWFEATKNVSWEVNTLARVERMEPKLPLWWYRADHDASIFTNYQTTEHADARRSPVLAQRDAVVERN